MLFGYKRSDVIENEKVVRFSETVVRERQKEKFSI